MIYNEFKQIKCRNKFLNYENISPNEDEYFSISNEICRYFKHSTKYSRQHSLLNLKYNSIIKVITEIEIPFRKVFILLEDNDELICLPKYII